MKYLQEMTINVLIRKQNSYTLRHGALRGRDSAIKPRKDMTHQEEAANRNGFKLVGFNSILHLGFGQELDIM